MFANIIVLVSLLVVSAGCSGGIFELKRERVLPPVEPITTGQPPSPPAMTSTMAASFMSCSDEYQQFTKNADGLIEFTKELKASGRVSTQELISVDQDAGMLSARVKNACTFLINNRIKFSEYREEVDKATADYKILRKMVLEKSNKN